MNDDLVKVYQSVRTVLRAKTSKDINLSYNEELEQHHATIGTQFSFLVDKPTQSIYLYSYTNGRTASCFLAFSYQLDLFTKGEKLLAWNSKEGPVLLNAYLETIINIIPHEE